MTRNAKERTVSATGEALTVIEHKFDINHFACVKIQTYSSEMSISGFETKIELKLCQLVFKFCQVLLKQLFCKCIKCYLNPQFSLSKTINVMAVQRLTPINGP